MLSKDKEAPPVTIIEEIPTFVKPWCRVEIISNKSFQGTELSIAKSIYPKESKNIADIISGYTKLPIETSPLYPV